MGALTIVAVILAMATPAGAHGTSGPPASNFATTVAGVLPAAGGVTARLGPDGEQVELRVRGDERVIVEGYHGEPYLRIDRRGVFENTASPAVRLNRSRIPSGPPSRRTVAAVHWVRVSSAPVARWHDHRAHWMGGATPSAITRAPERAHVIERWRIPLAVDGTPSAIFGRVVWNPPPTAWHWLGLAAALLALVVVGVRVAPKPVLLVATLTIAVGETLHLWGSWPFSTASTLGRVAENLPSFAAIAVATFTVFWLTRRSIWNAAPLLVVAGLFGAVAGGLSDLAVLSHSWIPSRLDPGLARTLVAANLGFGTAVALVGLMRLRARSEPDPASRPDEARHGIPQATRAEPRS